MRGAVPVAGDLFDVFFKANRRNLELQPNDRASEAMLDRTRVDETWRSLPC